MKLLLLAASLALLVVPGMALRCFKCAVSTSICVSRVTCDENELCYSRNRTALGVTVYSSGCTEKTKCGQEVTDTVAGISYTMMTNCCDVDYCNSAAGLQLSLLSLAPALIAWVTRIL
ncbi:sperm acrosome membrane-associated protein 4-like [Hemiscyllium ocellatum]|uniref:sperm acrosome membrane-associated protein 4-like n=1 Tax=Hemiscyllium ocellatum TaxID=170820 RepID=UPI0029677163|nr:sperm acrosome membrane-associated protein 4-like [Hemiscyllium ocellatum]